MSSGINGCKITHNVMTSNVSYTFEPSCEKTNEFEFQTRSDTNHPVQSQMQTRSLKFQISEEEGLYYQCREKGTDQLQDYREAGLHL